MARRKANTNTSFEETGVNRFFLRKITPLNDTQSKVFEGYENGKHLMLHGYAGTGKSFLSLYLALKELLTTSPIYDKIIIIRSVVQGRDMGFLPGTEEEKMKVYEDPYRAIFEELFSRKDAYDVLKHKNKVEFMTTSFLRGITFNRAIVIVDEIQNMDFGELSTIITRIGSDSKIIFCGDFRQTDLKKNSEKAGLAHFINITRNMDMFEYIDFTSDVIVRSALVKSFIIASTKYAEENSINLYKV